MQTQISSSRCLTNQSPIFENLYYSKHVHLKVKSGTVTKDEFRTFYAGSEVVVAGQLTDTVTEFTPTLSGFCGVDNDGTARVSNF